MIIFDLDNCVADCKHRRHFVDPSKNNECEHILNPNPGINYQNLSGWYYKDRYKMCEPPLRMQFIPDYRSFHEACSEDKPIEPVIEILDSFYFNSKGKQYFLNNVQIWSGRCESVIEKTLDWLREHILFDKMSDEITLKMRPIGDNTPDDQLKERWLDEAIAEGKTIYFVVDDRPKVVRMWRRRGVFVFDVYQGDKEF